MMGIRGLAAMLSVVVVLAACGGGEAGGADKEGADGVAADSAATDSSAVAVGDSSAADSSAAKKIAEAVPVEISMSHLGEISSYLLFSSTVETEEAVEIYSQRSGLVEAVLAEEGDKVSSDFVLARLTEEETRIEFKESKINIEHLKSNYRRTEDLYSRKLISQQEFENQNYEFEQAALRFERAELALEYSYIKAPFAGVITARQVQVGSRVGTGTKLYDLIKLDDMIARVYVPGQYLKAIKRDQRAVVTSDFLEGVRLDGWVKRVSPVVDPNSGTFKVTIGIRDRWEELRPGLFVNVEIVTDTHTDAVLIPKEAVVYDGGERFVFVIGDSIATRVKLDAGYEDAGRIESLSGIEVGSPVIVVGQNGLKDGARVRAVNAQGEAEVVEADTVQVDTAETDIAEPDTVAGTSSEEQG
jgi:membrane fusion protein, multidrug efflux system